MFLKIVLVILMIELVIVSNQASLFLQHNVYAQEPVMNLDISKRSNLALSSGLTYEQSDTPSYIKINRLGINAAIGEGYVKEKDGIWKVYMNKLSYAENMGTISNPFSNIVLYGHATEELLGDLPQIRKGDKITIFGYYNSYEYQVVKKESILPDEPDKLLSMGETNLSLFTCDGEEDEKRLLVKAKLVKIKKLPWKEVLTYETQRYN